MRIATPKLPWLRAWAMGCALVLALTAAAQPTKTTKGMTPEQLKQLQPIAAQTLAALVKDDARLDLAIDTAYGRDLAPEKRAVAKAAMRAMLADERLPAYMLQFLAPVLTPTMSASDVQPYVMQSIRVLRQRGIRRLSTERKVQFMHFMLSMAAAVPAATCKALFLGKLDTGVAERLEQRYTASLPLAGFEAVNALARDSMAAELAGYPQTNEAPTGQTGSTERAYAAAMNARLKLLPEGVNDRVLSSPETAEPAEACLWFRASTAAVLDMAEPYKGWYLTQVVGGD